MSLSLREQLLAAGLGTRKQARQVEHEQRRQAHKERQQPKEQKGPSDAERRAAEAKAAKAARDQELNRKREENARNKALWGEIKQLIEEHRLPKPDSDEYFNFIDRQKVRRITIDAALRERLGSGELCIVRCEGRYDIVPAEIAARIRERHERAVVSLTQEAAATTPPDTDDPYKDFVVPDDLRW